MGRETKYGRVTFERGTIGEDEPVFVLRGQDPYGPDAIRAYALICQDHGCAPEHVAAVREAADEMDAWQREHPTWVKEQPGHPTFRTL